MVTMQLGALDGFPSIHIAAQVEQQKYVVKPATDGGLQVLPGHLVVFQIKRIKNISLIINGNIQLHAFNTC